jgi:Tetratricopeptide repeat
MPVAQTISKWFLLAGILAGIHSAIFMYIAGAVALSGDPMAGMAFYLFYFLDYPISRLYQLPAYSSPPAMLIFGGLLWFSYGFIIQSLFSIRRMAGLLRLTTGVAFLCFLCLLPEFSLKSMPSWKEQWERGTMASEEDMDTKIWHVAEAVRLAPKDEPSLTDMWDYLGRLYMNNKDYERAEEAFKTSLIYAPQGPNPPSQTLWVYNNLAWLYERTGDTERRKEALLKAAEANRILYQGDSTQEAGCLDDLADIARANGDIAEAHALLQRAIAMESRLPQHPGFSSLTYMQEKLDKWKQTDVLPTK